MLPHFRSHSKGGCGIIHKVLVGYSTRHLTRSSDNSRIGPIDTGYVSSRLATKERGVRNRVLRTTHPFAGFANNSCTVPLTHSNVNTRPIAGLALGSVHDSILVCVQVVPPLKSSCESKNSPVPGCTSIAMNPQSSLSTPNNPLIRPKGRKT